MNQLAPTHARALGHAQADQLILVDSADEEIGYGSKADCHRGEGLLHRAFSLLLFNERGELLLQRRSASKPLWPRYWSNSCCSHPRRAETVRAAVQRRLREELGLRCPMQLLFKFRYQAQFDANHAEHELCHVLYGRTNALPRINLREISAWRWVTPEALQEELDGAGREHFTPWFLLEWQRIWRDHRDALQALRR